MTRLRTLLSVAAFVAFIGLFVVYLARNRSDFAPLTEMPPHLLVGIGLAHMIGLIMNAVFLIEILRPFGRELGVREATYVSLISSIGNYFTPFRGGAGVRALYLKRRHGLRYADFVSTFAGTVVMTSLIASSLGLVALAVVAGDADRVTLMWLVAFLAAVLIGSLALAIVGVPRWLRDSERRSGVSGVLIGTVRRVGTGWMQIVADRRLVGRLAGITLMNLLLVMVIALLSMAALGITTSLAAVVVYAVVTALSLFVAITPGALGIREAVAVLSAGAIGLSTSEVLALAIVDRGVLFVTLGLGWLFAPVLRKGVAIGEDLRPSATDRGAIGDAGGADR